MSKYCGIMIPIDDEVPRRVLAIYAHPDDCEVACGGTIASWKRQGAHVEVAVLTSGDKGTSDDQLDSRSLVQHRKAEMERSAEILCINYRHFFDLPDGSLNAGDVDLEALVVSLLRRVRPDTVVCPDPSALFFGQRYINHCTH